MGRTAMNVLDSIWPLVISEFWVKGVLAIAPTVRCRQYGDSVLSRRQC